MPEAPSTLSEDGNFDENNKKLLQFFEDITSNADDVQKNVLNEILSRNSGVEYLERHGLIINGNTDDYENFKKIMPIVTYEDLKPDIDRIADGDRSPILCSQPISEFLTRLVRTNFSFFFFIFLNVSRCETTWWVTSW